MVHWIGIPLVWLSGAVIGYAYGNKEVVELRRLYNEAVDDYHWLAKEFETLKADVKKVL